MSKESVILLEISYYSLEFNITSVLVMYIDNKMDSLSSLKSIKRHYKKDSRYVNDLYTLTYDNHESLDTVELISSLYFRTDITDDVSMIKVVFMSLSCGFLCGINRIEV